MSARETLEIATLGGAKVLGRKDCGSIEVAKRADIAIWDMHTVGAAGNWDPVAALVLTGPHQVKDLFVEGRQIVRDGHLASIDLRPAIEKHNKLALTLLS